MSNIVLEPDSGLTGNLEKPLLHDLKHLARAICRLSKKRGKLVKLADCREAVSKSLGFENWFDAYHAPENILKVDLISRTNSVLELNKIVLDALGKVQIFDEYSVLEIWILMGWNPKSDRILAPRFTIESFKKLLHSRYKTNMSWIFLGHSKNGGREFWVKSQDILEMKAAIHFEIEGFAARQRAILGLAAHAIAGGAGLFLVDGFADDGAIFRGIYAQALACGREKDVRVLNLLEPLQGETQSNTINIRDICTISNKEYPSLFETGHFKRTLIDEKPDMDFATAIEKRQIVIVMIPHLELSLESNAKAVDVVTEAFEAALKLTKTKTGAEAPPFMSILSSSNKACVATRKSFCETAIASSGVVGVFNSTAENDPVDRYGTQAVKVTVKNSAGIAMRVSGWVNRKNESPMWEESEDNVDFFPLNVEETFSSARIHR